MGDILNAVALYYIEETEKKLHRMVVCCKILTKNIRVLALLTRGSLY